MKKILLTIFLFVLFIANVNASTTEASEVPVVLTLYDNFYSTVTKTVKDNVSTFTYKNNLLTMNLTDSQLKTILKQKPGNGSSRLTYYETLNIKVKPVKDTPYESLKNKTTLYRANDGGSWISNASNYTSDMDAVALVKNLDNDFWPWGFKIQYRLDESGNFTSTVPSGVNLNDKTLEEQLATIFNINLTTNPNGVIDLYPEKIKFNPLPNRYIYTIRFDFFDEKNSAPILKENSSDEYLTNSLEHLGTHYAIIKYDRTEEATTYEDDSNSIPVIKEDTDNNLLVPITLTSVGIISSVLYILMKKGIIRI